MNCPKCGLPLTRLEICHDNPEETKTAWDCGKCNMIVYTVEFKEGD